MPGYMQIFYNSVGAVIFVLAILMARLSAKAPSQQPEFRSASRMLSILFLLVSLSMFAAQFEPKLPEGEFQMLNPLMLLFFFVICHGFIYTLLILFRSDYASRRKYFLRILPCVALYALYTVLYFFFSDPFLYSLDDLLLRLTRDPMLMLRCLIFGASVVSIIRGILLCQRESAVYNKRVVASGSEPEFEQSIVVFRFMEGVRALAVWALLTYLYTSPVLEIVSCTLIMVVFAFQFVGLRRFMLWSPVVALESPTPTPETYLELERRIQTWISRPDKPFVRAGLTIGDVAKEIGVSKSRLSAYLNDTQQNFRSWINDLRIKEAKHLLDTHKELTISEVAERTGFCDLPAFSRIFKKTTGYSPRTYRKGDNGWNEEEKSSTPDEPFTPASSQNA